MAAVKLEPSTFKSFMRPSSFWPKNKVNSHSCSQPNYCSSTEKPALATHSIGRKLSIPSSSSSSSHNVALKETAKGEVYKLSIVEDGSYRPPSPGVEGKRDNWLDIREDIMDFNLPHSMACLTTQDNEKHDFFTPYTFVHTQPYVLPVADLFDSSSASDSSSSSSSSIY